MKEREELIELIINHPDICGQLLDLLLLMKEQKFLERSVLETA